MVNTLSTTNSSVIVGQNNLKNILSEIIFHGPVARVMIAEKLKLTQATVSRVTRSLIDMGLIEEYETVHKTESPGRRSISLRIKSDGCFIVGLSINVYRQDIVITDLSNKILATRRLTFNNLSDVNSVLFGSVNKINELIDETGVDRNRLIGCGVSVAGAVEPEKGYILSAPLLGWSMVNVSEYIESALNIPVYVDNIPNSKNMVANGFGTLNNSKNVVLLNASLSFGCSLLVDGSLLRGKEYNVGLISDLLVPVEGSRQFLPLDKVAGGFAIVKQFHGKAFDDNISESSVMLQKIMEKADNGDADAINSMTLAGEALAYTVIAINGLLHPETILLSGPLVKSKVYCKSVSDRIILLTGSETIFHKLCFEHIPNQELGSALVIFRSLEQNNVALMKFEVTA